MVWDVSQISMPMRILLIGAAVFLAAWFTVLKPGGAEEVTPAASSRRTPTQPATTAATAAATPAAAEPTENTPVADVGRARRVLAKLPEGRRRRAQGAQDDRARRFADDASEVWRPMADDDRYVRNALKKTNRYDGEVFAKHSAFRSSPTTARWSTTSASTSRRPSS